MDDFKTYRDFGFDENLLRLLTKRPLDISANDFDAFVELSEGAVKESNLEDDAVTNDKLAALAVAAANIADASITEEKIVALAVTAGKIANASINVDKLADLAVSANKLAENSVTTTKIANAAVGSAAIANAAGGSAAIANAAVGAAAIANLAVGSAAIANGAIVNAKIADGTILTAKIGDAQIVNAKIANLAVDATKIADATITNAKIHDLSADKIDAGTLTGRTVKANNGTGADVWMSNNGTIVFRYSSDTQAIFYCDTSGNLWIDADNSISLYADGSGDDITIVAGDDLGLIASKVTVICSSDAGIECDDWAVFYNDDNDGSDCFWVSNGSTKMKLDQDGNLDLSGEVTASDYNYSDFAEYFEATKQYANKKIPLGTTVILEGDKIRPTNYGETPIGVISATAGFILGAAKFNWSKKYLYDDFGQKIYEEVDWWSIKKTKELSKKKRRELIEKKRKGEKLAGWVDEGAVPTGAEIRRIKRQKINPDYDPKKEYVSRKERSEWNIVGLTGKVRILKGQPVSPNWIKLRDISDTVEEWLIK